MGVLKGQNLRLKVNNKYIAYATTATIHLSQTLEDASHKDITGDWQKQEITGLAWDVSTDALFSVDEDASGNNATDSLNLVLAKQRVMVEVEIGTTGTKNRTGASKVYGGWAWVNDISINATNRQNATYTLQATGDGAFTVGASSNNDI